MIRGPGIPKNVTNSVDVYSMPDLGATILSLAGASATYTVDGREISFAESIDSDSSATNETALPRHALVEYWNVGSFEGAYVRKCSPLLEARGDILVMRRSDGVFGAYSTEGLL